eukprot:TRINITY_DN60364_c0_g1_i1.p1 TRINITY_DN60364_c0_g1~~TRINITY_DN60364_c0_g1_i1.p1  ORF type:complete len:404 (+),score=54.13 TRINITY_DN60364_c0_g1_i1:165-1376(+)
MAMPRSVVSPMVQPTQFGAGATAPAPVQSLQFGIVPSAPPAPQVGALPRSNSSAWANSEDQESRPTVVPLPPAPRRRGLCGRCITTGLRWIIMLIDNSQQQVRYPATFWGLLVIVVCLSVSWCLYYLFTVLPAIDGMSDGEGCRYSYVQLAHNAKMLFLYFVWFATARICLMMPCISSRMAAAEYGTSYLCRTHCIHVVLRDGALYIFAVGSLLLWFHLMQSPWCDAESAKLHSILRRYAIYCCALGTLCLFMTHWYKKLLVDANRHFISPPDAGAPADTLNSFETIEYSEGHPLFGEEDDKKFSGECSICLSNWDVGESIKITPCQHAFHEDCLARWLRNARTCALCRWDVTKPFERPVPEEDIERPAEAQPTPAPQPGATSARIREDASNNGSVGTDVQDL